MESQHEPKSLLTYGMTYQYGLTSLKLQVPYFLLIHFS